MNKTWLYIGGGIAVVGAVLWYTGKKAAKSFQQDTLFAGLRGIGEARIPPAAQTHVYGLAPSKARAQQWMAAKMLYQGETKVDHEVIDDVTGMELGRSGEMAKVLQRAYGQAPTYEHVPAFGIGRPE